MSNAAATPVTVDPSFFAAAVKTLGALVLGATVSFCGFVVTRSSLLGFDAPGLHGLAVEEMASALATFRGRVQAALAQAGEHLRTSYGLRGVGHFHPEYGVSHSAKKPVARITFKPAAPLSMAERGNIIATAIYFLREAVLGASQAGDLEIRCLAM